MTTNKAIEILEEANLTKEEEKALDVLFDANDRTTHALNEIVWMARRYADGRQTYAPSMFNEAYDILQELYGNFELDRKDITLINNQSFPYAETRKQKTTNYDK